MAGNLNGKWRMIQPPPQQQQVASGARTSLDHHSQYSRDLQGCRDVIPICSVISSVFSGNPSGGGHFPKKFLRLSERRPRAANQA